MTQSVLFRRLLIALLMFSVVCIIGIVGYVMIERWSFLEAAYMTVITLASVGFREVRPLSDTGQIFTIFLILGGVGTLLFAVSTFTAFIVEGELKDIMRRRRMERKIANLSDHYIVCGAGELGKHVITELIKTKKKFVVIDNDEESIKKLPHYEQLLQLQGNADEEAILVKCNIEKAKGLICALPQDKDNLFLVLTARALNPNLRIVTRAIGEESEHKLLKAGADRVVYPTKIGGLRMASEMIRPTVVSFLDIMMRGHDITLRVEEAAIPSGSPYIGRTLGESQITKEMDVIVVAIKNSKTGKYTYNPRANTKLNEQDVLIVLGEVEQVDRVRVALEGKKAFKKS